MNHNQLIKLIVTCLFLSFCTPSSSSVLRKAINSQDVPKVKGLVRNGANVNSKDQDLGWNALMTASDLGNLELVEFLLESKAEVNALDHNGATALIIACMNGHLLIVDKLISAKANLDIVDNKGYSALMYSVLYGYKYIYELLIISNANTELKSKDLKTARVLLKEKMGLIKLETNRSIKDSPPIPIIEINLKKFFPEEAKKANITNKTVIVLVGIDEYGNLDFSEVISERAGYGFEETAIEIVNKIRFLPGYQNNKPVKMKHRIPINFILD